MNVLKICLSSITSVQSGRVILRIGHVGQNFFFIYSGSAFVNVEDQTSSGEVFLKTQVVFSKGDSFGVSCLQNQKLWAYLNI